MAKFIQIEGRKPLSGQVQISGSYVSVMKIIAASILSNDEIILDNVPYIQAVFDELSIFETLGGKFSWISKNKLSLDASGINSYEIPFELGVKTGNPFLLVGPLIYRFGKAFLPKNEDYSNISRIIESWRSLGMTVTESRDAFMIEASNLNSTDLTFKVGTHAGTDNAILSSVFISGDTLIHNAAQEPEVDDLISFLSLLGAKVERIEDRTIKVTGTDIFNGSSKETIGKPKKFKVMNDRNEVVFFALAALITKGSVLIKGVDKSNIFSFVNILSKLGVGFEFNLDELRVWHTNTEFAPLDITVSPYPGFMTSWQPLMTAFLTSVPGESTINETIYTDGFEFVRDLNIMGASITLHRPSEFGFESITTDETINNSLIEPSSVVKIKGISKLRGTKIVIDDVRSGLALILAALSANGTSEIYEFEKIDKYFEGLLTKLLDLGAKVDILG